MSHVAVLGAGTWGTTFAKVLVEAGTPAVLWARRPALAEQIQHQHANPDYLPGVRLPVGLRATADTVEALRGCHTVVLAVPSQTLRETLLAVRDELPAGVAVVSLMKGVELGTSLRMSEVIVDVAAIDARRVAVITGPNLAREIALHQPTATVVAASDHDLAVRLQRACRTPYFRPYTNTDLIGCELAGAVKNVIALAVGIAAGMGFGDNTQASLITRGLAETARLGVALGADPLTFAGLAGMGDLVATCSSPLSRNRAFGTRLGQGESVADAAGATREVAEGVKSCRAILDLATRHGIDVPIIEHVVAAVEAQMTPAQMVRSLMSRDAKPEMRSLGGTRG